MAGRMKRIALILILFVLLTNAPHFGQQPPLQPLTLRVVAEPLPLPSRASYGPLRLEGLWRLKGSHPAFGGISALLVDGERGGALHFTGLDDSGEHVAFTLRGNGEAHMAALPRLPEQADEKGWMQDTESMTRDSASGRIWAGFESTQRICRYAPGFARIEGCASAEALKAWPIQGSIESLVRFGDGRFMAIAERAISPSGGFDVLLWASDPVDPATPPPVHLSYRAPTGYRPTDALWLGGDSLLVLNRRFTVFGWFTAKLVLVRLPRLEEGALLRGETIATFDRPGPIDNFEALALSREGNRAILWVASDDNHLSVQKTLLFRFALPRNWVSNAPAP